jgi:hypothetical protein
MTFPLGKRTCDWECAITVKLAIFTDGRPCPRSAQPQLEIGAPPERRAARLNGELTKRTYTSNIAGLG